MRPVFNRPEMLYLSLEAEQVAREYYNIPDTNFLNLFIVEYGADEKVKELVESFGGEKEIIYREARYGLSKNILEGMKYSFNKADDYLIYIEDDVLVHKTYFQFMDVLMNSDIKPYSFLSPYSQKDRGSINDVSATNHYAALAPLINKPFFNKYIAHCADDLFYQHPQKFIIELDKSYGVYGKGLYKYKGNHIHYQQAGLINRLTDIARIKENIQAYAPTVNRQQHIGMYGYNRIKGDDLSGGSFEERVSSLRKIINDVDSMNSFTGDKRYLDYTTFDERLDEWDGTIDIRSIEYNKEG